MELVAFLIDVGVVRRKSALSELNRFEISDAIEAKSALVTKCLGLDKNSSLRHFSRIMQVSFSDLEVPRCLMAGMLLTSTSRSVGTSCLMKG